MGHMIIQCSISGFFQAWPYSLCNTQKNKYGLCFEGCFYFSQSNFCRQLAYKSHGMIITFLISAPYFFLLIRSFKLGPRNLPFFKENTPVETSLLIQEPRIYWLNLQVVRGHLFHISFQL